MGKTLYITDLDGTLLNPQQQITSFTAKTINGLVEKGLLFSFATARSYSSASAITKSLSLRLPLVLNNGVFLTEAATGEIRHVSAMAPDRIRAILNILEANEVSALVYSLIDGRERVSWLPGRESQGVLRYLQERAGDPRLHCVARPEQLLEGDVFYVSIIEDEARARQICRLLEQDHSISLNLSNDIYCPEEWWVEFYHRDVSKAAGIERLRKLVGADRVVCFGDHLNDLSMFRSCAEAYAVANAEPEVKRAATAVIGSNEEDGVAHWLLAHGRID